MVSPLGDGRFRLEARSKQLPNTTSGTVIPVPYRNVQHTCMMGAGGQTFTCEIPYRGFADVITANLYPGQHELWFFDHEVSDSDPVFAGPLWSLTAASSGGVLSCSAQDPLSYLAKGILRNTGVYKAKTPCYVMNDLATYQINKQPIAAGQGGWRMTTSIDVDNADTHNYSVKASDLSVISDLLASVAGSGSGVDYYVRTTSTGHVLHFFGGRIRAPLIPAVPLFVDYPGGKLDGYSLEITAQAMGNLFYVGNGQGVVGSAQDTGSQAIDGLYEVADNGSSLTTLASLNSSAAGHLPDIVVPKVIPSLVSRSGDLVPIRDFDFGHQLLVQINDEYAQYSGTIRVIGWQNTIGAQDNMTSVIYSRDSASI